MSDTILVRAGWWHGKQAELFARRVGGQVIVPSAPYEGPVIEIPRTYKVRCRNRYSSWVVDRPTFWDVDGGRPGEIELAGTACEGEVLLPHECVWDSFPSGRPYPLRGDVVENEILR